MVVRYESVVRHETERGIQDTVGRNVGLVADARQVPSVDRDGRLRDEIVLTGLS